MNDGRCESLGKASQSMTIGSVGSQSFWQQDQNFWSQAQSDNRRAALSNALISAMGGLMSNEVKGKASVAIREAQTRVHAQLVAALQNAVQASKSASASKTSTTGSPAI